MSDFDGDSSDFSISDSDDDLELQEARVKNENYLEETVPAYDEESFSKHFRVSRGVATTIAQQYEASQFYSYHSGQYGKLSGLSQVLIFLWFIGHQTASFADVSDRFNVTKSSLHRIITKVTLFLSNMSPQIIRWPTENEKLNIEQHFRENGFPNVIGAIDGSHIKIDKPEQDPDSYLNRKNYYSVQMQVVCDNTRRIRDVFIGYPGSVHDSRVFRNSPLYNTLPEKCGRFYLLGDSGDPLKPQLLTPFKDRGQLTRRQINYNIKLSRNRYVIEHCFGIIKQKFRQLYHVKLRNMVTITHFIRSACVLHNIALDDNFEVNENELDQENLDNQLLLEDVNVNFHEAEDDDRDAILIRNNVVNMLRL